MTTRDLWGDLPENKEGSADAILREQGQHLAEKTNHEVRGYVPIRPFTRETPWGRRDTGFTVDFYFEVPNLNGYRYLFLEVELPVSMGYPVELKDRINDTEYTCDTRAEFEQKLQEAFTSEAVRDVIAGLRTASRSMNQEWSEPLPHQ